MFTFHICAAFLVGTASEDSQLSWQAFRELAQSDHQALLGLTCLFEGHVVTRTPKGPVQMTFTGEFESSPEGWIKNRTLYQREDGSKHIADDACADGVFQSRMATESESGPIQLMKATSLSFARSASPEYSLGFGLLGKCVPASAESPGAFRFLGTRTKSGDTQIGGKLEFGLETYTEVWIAPQKSGAIVEKRRSYRGSLSERLYDVEFSNVQRPDGVHVWIPVKFRCDKFQALIVEGSANDLPGGTIVEERTKRKPRRLVKAYREPVESQYLQIIARSIQFKMSRKKDEFALSREKGTVVLDHIAKKQERVGLPTGSADDLPSLQTGLDDLSKQAQDQRAPLTAKYGDNQWIWIASLVAVSLASLATYLYLRRS